MNNLSGASDEKLLKLFTVAVNDWINPENDQYYSESWTAFNRRVQTALMASLNSTAKTGLVFTSGGVIASIIGTAWQLTAEQSMKLNWTLVNTGITKLLVNDGKIRVSTVNEYPHLDNQQNKNKITYK
jgi:broad specificity phosphatase PhoE